MRYVLLGLTGLLIIYGSLYPFAFAPAAPDAIVRMFSNWELTNSRGDILGNIVLFVPWGVAGVFSMAPRLGAGVSVALTAGLGFAIALGVQVGQVWVPSRFASMGDVFWNLVGLATGALLGRLLLKHLQSSSGKSVDTLTAWSLIVAWVLVEWSPLVPSLDFQLVKDQVKLLLAGGPAFSIPGIVLQTAVALFLGSLLGLAFGGRRALWLLPSVLGSIALGKLFFRGASMDASVLLGFTLGTCGWWAIYRLSEDRRNLIVVCSLLAAYTTEALSPFVLRDTPAAVSWVPFAAMLQGSMMTNLGALLSRLVLYASILQTFRHAGGTPSIASVGLAFWVLVMELMQTLIDTRSADFTEPLLVLLLGQGMGVLVVRAPADQKVRAAPPRHSLVGQTSSRQTQLLTLIVAVLVIGIGVGMLLRLPNIPYNVKELFWNEGSIGDLVLFALALLWAGVGPVWLARRLVGSNVPELKLPVFALAVSLISLTLLWSSVTAESIGDIAGSSNLFWSVTNETTWGEVWRQIFLRVDAPEIIGFLERCVRYSSLYAPLPIFLGLMIAVRQWLPGRCGGYSWLLRLLASALLVLWLCKAVAFDWSSTDNLNELIARDGEWGWGGGGYLYAVLLLICLNGLLLADLPAARCSERGGILLFSLVAFPLGWWLVNQGLEQQVQKYGQVFSGVQFLLGPDRSHTLSSEILFMRWCAVQACGVLVLGVGIWLGNAALMGGRAGLPRSEGSASVDDRG